MKYIFNLISTAGFIGYFYYFMQWFPLLNYFGIVHNNALSIFPKFERTALFFGNKAPLRKINSEPLFDTKTWQEYHIADFLINFPVRSPLITFTPIIQTNHYREIDGLGINFSSQSHSRIVRVIFKNEKKIRRHLLSNPLFQLPILLHALSEIPKHKLWQDLYGLDIHYPQKIWDRDFWEMGSMSIKELTYNLYILYLRHLEFDKNLISFTLNSPYMSTLQFPRKIQVHKFRKNKYYSYHLDRTDSLMAIQLEHFIKESTKVRPSFPRAANHIYQDFLKLSYSEKVTDRGALTLFSAWTHQTDNKKFLQSTMNYLERGKNNFNILNPLYRHAFEKYGNNFQTKIAPVKTQDWKEGLVEETPIEIPEKKLTKPVEDDFIRVD